MFITVQIYINELLSNIVLLLGYQVKHIVIKTIHFCMPLSSSVPTIRRVTLVGYILNNEQILHLITLSNHVRVYQSV